MKLYRLAFCHLISVVIVIACFATKGKCQVELPCPSGYSPVPPLTTLNSGTGLLRYNGCMRSTDGAVILQPTSITGGLNVTAIGNIQYINSSTAGADWGAKVNTVDTSSACAGVPCEIWIDQTAGTSAPASNIILSSNHILRFVQGGNWSLGTSQILLNHNSGIISSYGYRGQGNQTDNNAVTLNYTGTSFAVGPQASSTLNIVSSTNTSPIVITVSSTNIGRQLVNGDTIGISNHLVNTAANGMWFISNVTGTTFSLNGSTGNGVGGATGIVSYPTNNSFIKAITIEGTAGNCNQGINMQDAYGWLIQDVVVKHCKTGTNAAGIFIYGTAPTAYFNIITRYSSEDNAYALIFDADVLGDSPSDSIITNLHTNVDTLGDLLLTANSGSQHLSHLSFNNLAVNKTSISVASAGNVFMDATGDTGLGGNTLINNTGADNTFGAMTAGTGYTVSFTGGGARPTIWGDHTPTILSSGTDSSIGAGIRLTAGSTSGLTLNDYDFEIARRFIINGANNTVTSYDTTFSHALIQETISGGSYPFNNSGNLVMQTAGASGSNVGDIVFATGVNPPVTAVVITGANQRVGIGTTSPSAALSVGASSQFQVSTTGAVSTTSSITPSQTNGIVGTTTNNNANAGSFGEYVTSTLATGSSLTITSGTPLNITSISLTAGDWDVSGTVDYTAGATTSITNERQGISTTSATLGGQDTFSSNSSAAEVPTAAIDEANNTPIVRLSLASTTTVFLVSSATFTVSSLKGYGTIRARRIR